MARQWYAAGAHGDGKGNHDFPKPRQEPSPEGAAEGLVRIVNANPGQVDVVAIGPLTNIATALMLDRTFASKVRQLWVMGGCDNSVGNVTAAAEYNFYVDPVDTPRRIVLDTHLVVRGSTARPQRRSAPRPSKVTAGATGAGVA